MLVHPAERLNVLECTIAGNAEAIVTGDEAMLMMKKLRHIRIMTLIAELI